MINCEFENGNKASLRHVTVGVIAENDKDEILLVKRAPHLTRGGKYTVPGGFVDRDETIQKAALRELREETGYNGKLQKLFHINDFPYRANEDRQNIDFLFIVKVGEKIGEIDSETTEVNWYTEGSLPSEEEFAFDHRTMLLKYFKYLKKEFDLPLIGKIE